MTECNDSRLLDGGDSVGMTDNQYKGMPAGRVGRLAGSP